MIGLFNRMTKNLNAMFQTIRFQSTASWELWALTKHLSFVEVQVTICTFKKNYFFKFQIKTYKAYKLTKRQLWMGLFRTCPPCFLKFHFIGILRDFVSSINKKTKTLKNNVDIKE